MTIFPPDPDFEALRQELARLRAAKAWSYDELAARSGLARRTLIEIEQGRTIGTLKTWHALAHALSTPLDELFATLCRGHEPPAETDGWRPSGRQRQPPESVTRRERVIAQPKASLTGCGSPGDTCGSDADGTACWLAGSPACAPHPFSTSLGRQPRPCPRRALPTRKQRQRQPPVAMRPVWPLPGLRQPNRVVPPHRRATRSSASSRAADPKRAHRLALARQLGRRPSRRRRQRLVPPAARHAVSCPRQPSGRTRIDRTAPCPGGQHTPADRQRRIRSPLHRAEHRPLTDGCLSAAPSGCAAPVHPLPRQQTGGCDPVCRPDPTPPPLRKSAAHI